MSKAASRLRTILKNRKTSAISSKPVSIKDIAEEPNLEEVVKKINQAASKSNKFRNRHNIYYFCMSRLTINKRYNLIEEVVDWHKQLEDITHEGYALRLMSFYARAGMFENARKLFDELPQLGCVRSVKSLNTLLKAALVAKRFDEVSHLCEEVPNELMIKLDIVSYNVMIHALCEKGSLDEALLVLYLMKENGVNPNTVTFNTLLDPFYRERGFEGGERIWGMMDDYNVVQDTRSYYLKMRGLFNEGKVKEAVALFEGLEGKGLLPDENCFNGFIKEYCDQGDLDEAKKYYNAMLESGCPPNRITFSTLVPKLCDNGDYDIAFGLCKKMFKRQFVVDEALLQLVVDGLAKRSMVKEAKELVELGKSNVFVHYDLVLPADDIEKEEVEEQIKLL